MAEVHRQIQVQLEDVVSVCAAVVIFGSYPCCCYLFRRGHVSMLYVITDMDGTHPQLKLFHSELLTQLEQKLELDIKYLTVSDLPYKTFRHDTNISALALL